MRVCVWWGREGFRDRVCVLMSDIMTIEKEEEKKHVLMCTFLLKL